LNLDQIKLQSCQHQRIEFALFFSATVQAVDPLLERQDLEGFVGRVADPVFLHAKAGVEILLVIAIPAHSGWRDKFDQEVRRPEDGATLDDGGLGGGNEDQVRLNRVFGDQNNINRRIEHLAQAMVDGEAIDDTANL